MYRSLALSLVVALVSLTGCDGAVAPDLDTAPSAAVAPPAFAIAEGVAEVAAIPLGGELVLRDGLALLTLPLGGELVLRDGLTLLTLTFDALLSDTRCPVDALCVWAGEAIARFTLHAEAGTTYPVVLAIPGQGPDPLPFGIAPTASAAGVRMHFVQLTPYPSVPARRDEGRRVVPVATFVIEACPGGTEVCGPGGDAQDS